MKENETNNISLKVELPPSLDNAVKNLTDNPSLTAGTIISDLLDLTLGPVSYWAEKARLKREFKLKQFHQKLLASADKIPSEKLVEPSLQIAAQALEDSKYCISEETLQDMFVALISRSMNSDFSDYIHPSFSGIIRQMSVLDAKIIALFKNERLPGLPVCQYGIRIPGTTSTSSIPEHIFLEMPESAVFPNSLSLESLSRFGLITISYFEFLHDETLYEKFSTHPFYRNLQEQWPVGKVYIKKGIVRLTPLGKSFVKICVPD